jgi:PrcB C-terminal
MRPILLLAVTFIACAPGTQPDGPREAFTGDDPATVLLHTAYSGFDQEARLVVRDLSGWNDVWSIAFARHTPTPPRPAIDFATEMVVVAALGSRPSGGYGIAIEGVSPETGGVEIDVVTTSPGSGCIVTGALTQPVMMIRMAAADGAVRFRNRAEVRACD